MGDYNCTSEEGGVAIILADGVGCSAEDSFATGKHAARDVGSRRIDFGLCSPHIWASELLQTDGVADHHMVAYKLDYNTDEPRYAAPWSPPLPRDTVVQ